MVDILIGVVVEGPSGYGIAQQIGLGAIVDGRVAYQLKLYAISIHIPKPSIDWAMSMCGY
jgi:hypothetical protein